MTKKRESRVEDTSQVLRIDELKFTDVFDLGEVQKLQDAFAAATGVASIITDVDGTPFTEPSQFCEMCQLVRKTDLGRANCFKSDAELGKPHPGGPILQPCLSGGLWDGGVSIYLGDRHIGNWLIGQILTGDAEVEKVLAYGEQVGVDPKAFREAVSKVTRMPLERFEKVGEALYVFSQQLSRMALQNAQQKIEIARREQAEAERARIEKLTRLEEVRTRALLELNQMTGASLKEIADFALDAALQLTDSALGYLAFTNADESVLTMYSWSKSAMAECALADKPVDYPIETTGLWGEALRQRRPIITNDYPAPNPLKRGYPEGHIHLTRHMNIPVFYGEHIVAVAGVGNKAEDYTDGDVQQLLLLMQGMWRLIQRQRDELALREREQQLRGIAESVPGVVYQFSATLDGAEFGMVYVSERMVEIFGLTGRIETLFPQFIANIHPDDQERFQISIQTAITTQTPWNFEGRYIKPSGEILWFNGLSTPVRRDDRLIFNGLLLDVTARKQAEIAAAENTARLRNILNALPLGMHMYRLDPDGRLVFIGANTAADKLLGVDNTLFVGKTIEEAFPPLAETEVPARYRAAAAEGQSWQTQQVAYDEGEIQGAFEVYAFQTSPGEMAAGFLDATERMRAQAERERFITRLDTAADISAQVTAILDPDELLRTVIPLIKERFGLYYVHVYTLDEESATLNLRAGYGEPGRIMLERGHSIPLSREQSLVATAARTGESVLVNDVTQNPNFMPNPLLPDTRAEVAVPAIAGGKVLGVFDVQHDRANYFTQVDLDVFLTLTGQIAISLQNARYVEEVARQRAFYDGIITNLPVGVWAVDQQFKPLLVNPAGRAMMGREVKDQGGGAYVENYEVININTGELYDNTQLPLVKAVTQGGTYTAVDAGVRWPDGTVVPQLINAAPLLDPDGTQTGAVVIFIDATEQQRAQAAVRESEMRQRMILETLPIGVVIIRSSNETILYANQVYAELVGFASAKDLLGKVVPVTFEEPADLQKLTRKLQEQDQVAAQEMRLKRPDGKVLWVLVSILPIQFGAEQFMLSSLVDITARKQAEAEREQFATHLRVAAEITTEISAILDADALFETLVRLTKERFNLYHAQYYDLDEEAQTLKLRFGYGQAGQMMKQRGYKVPLKAGRELVSRAAHTKEVVVAHDLTREADYTPNMLLLDARSEVALPLIVGGRVLGILDVVADQAGYFTSVMVDVLKTLLGQVVTTLQNVQYFAQQKEAEGALRNSSEQIRAMFDAMGDGVIVSNMIGEITDMNEASFALLGYASRVDLLHHNILEMIVPTDRSQASVGWVTAMESGSSGVQAVTLQRKDGSTFAGEMTAALLRDVEGNPVGFVNICRNISQRK